MNTISRSRRPLLPPATSLSDRAPGSWRLRRRSGSPAGRLFLAVAEVLMVWQKRLKDREALRSMTAAQLQDIGISREDALREAEKAFWHR